MTAITLPENPHARSQDEVVEQLTTDIGHGLSAEEVGQRREQYGPNQLKERKQKSLFQVLLDQVNTPVVYLLAAAAALSFVFGDIPEGVAILVVLLINAVIGFWMEWQARKSMNALKEMDKIEAHLLREGETQLLDAEQIVPGDILVLEAGDVVAADARLVSVSDLQINESALTGESVPVDKNTDPSDKDASVADRKNMVFKGTAVTRGKGRAVVTATGMETEIGNISDMVSSASEEAIPLDKKLNRLTKKLIWIVLGMAVALGLIGTVTGKDTYTLIQTAIAWAIAAIPEGLPIVASIALARGMLRLADHQVVVKKLAVVEALGETNAIFTDKTGTLTENRLTVQTLYVSDQPIDVQWKEDGQGLTLEQDQPEAVQKMLDIAVLCNDATYDPDHEDDQRGDPLEIALLQFAHALDAQKRSELAAQERVAEDPFDAESKMMGTIHQREGTYFIAGKGATEPMLEVATHLLQDGQRQELTEAMRKEWMERSDALAKDGLRTLAFAYRESEELPPDAEGEFLHDLTLVGLVGFLDPPQTEVREAIETCRHAGIEVVMVTGDHPETARKIASEVRLVDDESAPVLRGREVKEKEKSGERVSDTRVFSRVDPAQKLELVERFQQEGKIVAMTGDGVNDAPALKKADIGIAMGLRGTQVAQEVADMVLKDDNFTSIVRAIRQGRIIFSNIRKFIVYQLSYHLSEILVIAAVSFSLFELPLLPLQLLFLNILTDVFPALAIGIGEGRANVMDDPPKNPKEPILNKTSWWAIGTYGAILATGVSGVFFFAYYVWDQPFEVCNTMAFFSLGFSQLLHALDMRDPEEPVFLNQITKNMYVWLAIAFCTAALIAAYFVPGLRELLSLQAMEPRNWLLIGIGSISPIIVIQLVKGIFRKF